MEAVNHIIRKSEEAGQPHTYDAVLALVDDAIHWFERLLEDSRSMWDE